MTSKIDDFPTEHDEERGIPAPDLLECTHALLETPDFVTAAETIVKACKKATGAAAGYIALTNGAGTENEVVYLDAGERTRSVEDMFPMPVCKLRATAMTYGRVVFENDFPHSPYAVEGHRQIQNVLFAPLSMAGKVVGLLGIANKQGGFTGRDAAVAAAFGDLASVALVRKRQEEELRKVRCELEKTVAERTCELSEANRVLENVFSNVHTMVAYLDRDFNFLRVNDAYAKAVRHGPEYCRGRNHFDLFPDKENEAIFRNVVETGEPFVAFEKPFVHKDRPEGGVSYWDWTAQPVKDEDGRVGGIVLTLIDRTERRKVRHDRERLVRAVEEITEGVSIMSPGGIIEYANTAFCNMTGYPREELIGSPLNMLDSGKDGEGLYQSIAETLKEGSGWSGRVRSRRKDGSLFDHEERLSPIRGDTGAMINCIMVSRDVTEEVRRELQLQQSRKMEAIGTLAGGIAHDFNNALAAIIGFSEMALNKTTDAVVRRRIEQVLKAGIRGRELVRQILTFARKTEQERRPVRLSMVVEDIFRLLRASFPSPVEIRYNMKGESGPVLADATQIHQVLMNLCTNAYQSMQKAGGVIEILLSDYTLQPDSRPPHPDMHPGPYMALSVSDTGHGMESSLVERIFDPFFTTKKCGEGTGLGLSIVHTIIKNHRGAITVDTEVGKGSIFTVYLPKATLGEKAQTDEASPAPRGCERVLFVDDEESLVEMGEEMLRELGYSVTAVDSGRKALELFRSGCSEFDLVITDLTMPDITGLELCRELLNIRPDTNIIVVTGYADAVGDRAKTSGASEFVMKPLTKDELARVMRRVLDGRMSRTV